MTELGSGISLDDELDLQINNSGDISTVLGSDELQKDAGFFLAIELQEELGNPVTTRTLARARARTRAVLNEDPRVNNVLNVDAEFVNEDLDQIEIVAEVNVDTGSQELVISLGE